MTWPCECALKLRTTRFGPSGLALIVSMAWLLIGTLTDPLWGAEPKPATTLPPVTGPLRPSRTAKVVKETAKSRESLQAAIKRLKSANQDLSDYAEAMNPPEELSPDLVHGDQFADTDPAHLDALTDEVTAEVAAGEPLQTTGETEADLPLGNPPTVRPMVGLHRELDDLKKQQEKRMARIKSQLLKWRRMRVEQLAAEAKARAEQEAKAQQAHAANDQQAGSGHGLDGGHGSESGHSSAAKDEHDRHGPRLEGPRHGSGAVGSETRPVRHASSSPSADPAADAAADNPHASSNSGHGAPHGSGDAPTSQAPGHGSTDDTSPFHDVTMLSSKAVDRLELANSLFALGRTESALAIYQQIDKAGLSEEDSIWLDYQLASSHRRTGNLAEAEKIYRRVITAAPDSTWGKYSRWWLELLRDRGKIQNDLTELQGAIKNFRTATEGQNEPTTP